MTIYLVIVTAHYCTYPVVDVFECLQDAQDRLKRAQANFPEHDGFRVTLLEKHVSPDLSTVFAS
jgi:hypothetical protein